MSEAYFIERGSVTKYIPQERKKVKRIYLYHIIYFVSFIISFVFTFWVFKKCITDKQSLSDTISLGSIFATFGSAIVSVFTISLSNIYERFCFNTEILFNELCPEHKWYRWPFIKREAHSSLYNNELTYQRLENAKIAFNLGSHPLHIYLPTIREDFYDLPNWRNLLCMLLKSKDYESYVLNNVSSPANSLLIWDCLLDNFKSIAIYKISKFMIVIGESFIFSSVVYAFGYNIIPF